MEIKLNGKTFVFEKEEMKILYLALLDSEVVKKHYELVEDKFFDTFSWFIDDLKEECDSFSE